MKLLEASPSAMTVQLTSREALMLNNALNEACNSDHISDLKYAVRIGGSRASVRVLLSEMNGAIDASADGNAVQPIGDNALSVQRADFHRIGAT